MKAARLKSQMLQPSVGSEVLELCFGKGSQGGGVDLDRKQASGEPLAGKKKIFCFRHEMLGRGLLTAREGDNCINNSIKYQTKNEVFPLSMKWGGQNLQRAWSSLCRGFLLAGKITALFFPPQMNEKDITLFPESSFLFHVCQLSAGLVFNGLIVFLCVPK